MNHDDNQIKCACKTCGTTWVKGEMGDNEEYCFRCEYLDSESQDEDYRPTNIKFLR